MDKSAINAGDKAFIILESLICYLRERNVLNRADIEALLDQVENSHALERETFRRSEAAIAAAVEDMAAIERYCGSCFGGKHRR